MFIYNLIAPLVFIAVFSLPALLLELQLLYIGFSWMTPSVMVATLVIGILSAIGAVVCEWLEGQGYGHLYSYPCVYCLDGYLIHIDNT